MSAEDREIIERAILHYHDEGTEILWLSDDHALTWTTLQDVEGHHGAIVYHVRLGARQIPDEPDVCAGGITFDTPEARQWVTESGGQPRPMWTVDSWDPLTISPSVLCSCGDHGFIRGGKWESA